jgi:hypothetical protein
MLIHTGMRRMFDATLAGVRAVMDPARLRWLATPHVSHGWDAGLWFDEATRTLFCSDLCFQPGAPPRSSGRT